MIRPASAPLRAALLLLAVLGLALPWWFNLRCFAAGGGLAPAAFFGAAPPTR